MCACFCPEITELKKLLKDYSVYNFKPSKDVLQTYMDGGVAIIDQWICAHARSVDFTQLPFGHLELLGGLL